jgi:hypothetical protein
VSRDLLIERKMSEYLRERNEAIAELLIAKEALRTIAAGNNNGTMPMWNVEQLREHAHNTLLRMAGTG